MGPRLAVLVRFLVAALVVAGAAGALAIARGPGRSITYAGRSSAATALLLIAGMGLAAAGLTMQTARRTRRSGVVVLLAAFAWFAPVFVAWQNGPALVRSVATVLSGLTLALVAHISLAYPGARIPSRPVRALVAAIYLEAAVVVVALALFRDPYFDPSCWANCTVNSFLVHPLPSFTHRVEVADRWFVIAAVVAVIAASVARLHTASRPALAGLVAVCLPAIVFAGAVGARSIALQNIAVEDPFNNTLFAIFVISAAALILLAAALVWSLVRRAQQRRALAQIVTSLDEAPAPGSVRAALAHALNDPELRIAYWLPHAGRYVDATGKAVPDPISPPGRVATRLLRDGRTIAVILHADAAGELEAQIGPAVLLGLENERLQADVLAQLEELRASRVRVVETADAERRALERDLHDGAQQRLLALSYDIRLARASAEANGDVKTAIALVGAIEETSSTIDELRTLAHGIYPAVLAEAGLVPALQTLADEAPMPVEIASTENRRYMAAAEAASYFAVAEAIDSAARRGADHATVSLAHHNGHLIVIVSHNSDAPLPAMPAVADRVVALGGNMSATATECRVEIPCE